MVLLVWVESGSAFSERREVVDSGFEWLLDVRSGEEGGDVVSGTGLASSSVPSSRYSCCWAELTFSKASSSPARMSWTK